MGRQIVRYQHGASTGWGVVLQDHVIPCPGAYTSLAGFLTEGGAAFAREVDPKAAPGADALPLSVVELLNPVTAPCRIIAQGTNYQSHRKEAASHPPFNLLFTKADSSLTSPSGPVQRPRGVRLLDYELELGLVIGRAISAPITVTAETLSDVVAGIVMANDVSARDVQIPEEQWFRGKSFRTFCPVGPYFYLLDAPDVRRLAGLRLQLWVNGEPRQDALASQLIYGPAQTLELLSTVLDLSPGDLVLTGTPGGVALRAPSPLAQRISSFLLPPRRRLRLFITGQLKRPQYLHDGDVVRSTIATADGAIDLGEQQWRVIPANAQALA